MSLIYYINQVQFEFGAVKLLLQLPPRSLILWGHSCS